MDSLLSQLRKAVNDDDRSPADIAEAAGMHPNNLSAFMTGRRDLSLKSVERLADALGFALRLTSNKGQPVPVESLTMAERTRLTNALATALKLLEGGTSKK